MALAKSAAQSCHEKLILIFGSDMKILPQRVSEYIEYEMDKDSVRRAIIKRIKANPLKSILLSSQYNRNAKQLDIWRTRVLKQKAEWLKGSETAKQLEIEVEHACCLANKHEKIMDKAVEILNCTSVIWMRNFKQSKR